MDLRLAVADIAARYQLTHPQQLQLAAIATVDAEPAALTRTALAGIGVLGAALGGLGVIFWIAANWESLGRYGKFALLEGLVLVMCAGAIWRPQAKLPLSLIAMLATGGLFAYFGQTYQTGADPWQLFALWGALTLPLCLSVRHDVAWAPWALIVMTAISLWMQANALHFFRVSGEDLSVHLAGWLASCVLCYLLRPAFRQWTGAGTWSLRVAAILTIVMISLTAGGGMFAQDLPAQFWIGLLLLGGAAAAFAQPRLLDIFVLSALALPINTLLIGLLVRMLMDGKNFNIIAVCLLVGGVAAVLLSLTVKFILAQSRAKAPGAPA